MSMALKRPKAVHHNARVIVHPKRVDSFEADQRTTRNPVGDQPVDFLPVDFLAVVAQRGFAQVSGWVKHFLG